MRSDLAERIMCMPFNVQGIHRKRIKMYQEIGLSLDLFFPSDLLNYKEAYMYHYYHVFFRKHLDIREIWNILALLEYDNEYIMYVSKNLDFTIIAEKPEDTFEFIYKKPLHNNTLISTLLFSEPMTTKQEDCCYSIIKDSFKHKTKSFRLKI